MSRLLTQKRLIVIAAILVLTLVPAVLKAVYISPHAVFLDHSNRTGQVVVGNSSEAPEEVTIELRFGFPDTDPDGNPFIRFVDDPGTQFPSAADWIRPFPRMVRLEPGTQQTVRLLATPPNDLPDGEYWTRMIVTSRGAPLPIVTEDTSISAGVSLEVRLIASVTYRKGHVETGIAVQGFRASAANDSLTIWVEATREGNAAYLGTAEFELIDQNGSTVSEWEAAVAVFYPMNRRFVFPLESVASGEYMLRMAMLAERSDLLDGQVLSAPPYLDSLSVAVP